MEIEGQRSWDMQMQVGKVIALDQLDANLPTIFRRPVVVASRRALEELGK